jgi:hypothetical protein
LINEVGGVKKEIAGGLHRIMTSMMRREGMRVVNIVLCGV